MQSVFDTKSLAWMLTLLTGKAKLRTQIEQEHHMRKESLEQNKYRKNTLRKQLKIYIFSFCLEYKTMFGVFK